MNKKMIAMAVALCAALSVQADVLYEANFTGDSTTSLNGTPVDTKAITSATHGTSATATWSGDGSWRTDGSNTANRDSIFLPFVATDGYVYTLTVELSDVTTSWIGAGFANTASGTGYVAVGKLTIWELLQTNDQQAHLDSTGGAGNIGTSSVVGSGGTMSIILDTRDGTGLWDVDYQFNGSSFATATDIGSAYENIAGVGFGNRDTAGAGTVDSFQLSVIPEPATLGLVATFGGGILFIRRRLML